MGQGDRKYADQVAVESMRKEMESLDMDGVIVIGEGERDEAPMLFIGERVGRGSGHPAVDIAVDPLEGTNLCATGAPNAIAVLAASEKGGLLNARRHLHGEAGRRAVVEGQGRHQRAGRGQPEGHRQGLGRAVADLVVIVLDRPRTRS